MKLTQFLVNSPLIWELDSHDLGERQLKQNRLKLTQLLGSHSFNCQPIPKLIASNQAFSSWDEQWNATKHEHIEQIVKEKFSVSLNSAIEQQGNGVYFSAFNFSPAIRIQFGLFEEINILLRQQLFLLVHFNLVLKQKLHKIISKQIFEELSFLQHKCILWISIQTFFHLFF